jgi:hypothetical protein
MLPVHVCLAPLASRPGKSTGNTMKWIRRVKVVYRNKFFYRLRWLLPRYAHIYVYSCGQRLPMEVPIGGEFLSVKCKRIEPIGLGDLLFFHYLINRY